MEKPTSYCAFVAKLPASNVHRVYHDTQYGFAVESDDELFGRLILEINQAGLSWDTILNKQHHFRKAYDGYDLRRVAAYGDADVGRLMSDAGIVRNRLKIHAAIFNAQKILELQSESGSFRNWLSNQEHLDIRDWVALFKRTFKFTGGEITKEFLMSTGHIHGAHVEGCPLYVAGSELKSK